MFQHIARARENDPHADKRRRLAEAVEALDEAEYTAPDTPRGSPTPAGSASLGVVISMHRRGYEWVAVPKYVSRAAARSLIQADLVDVRGERVVDGAAQDPEWWKVEGIRAGAWLRKKIATNESLDESGHPAELALLELARRLGLPEENVGWSTSNYLQMEISRWIVAEAYRTESRLQIIYGRGNVDKVSTYREPYNVPRMLKRVKILMALGESRLDEAVTPMKNLAAAGAVVAVWPATGRGPKNSVNGKEAVAVIEAFLKARGWKPDFRAGKNVWINADGQRRLTFKKSVVVYEIGGRGKWQKDYKVMPYGEALSTIKYATTLYGRALAAGATAPAPEPPKPEPKPEPAPKLKGWMGQLSKEKQEKLFVWMRAQWDKAAAHERRAQSLSPRGGAIAVGAAHWDAWIQGEAIHEFLRRLREGDTPKQALKNAKEWAHGAVAAHNAKRPKDVNWKRWEGTADGGLETLHRSLNTAGL